MKAEGILETTDEDHKFSRVDDSRSILDRCVVEKVLLVSNSLFEKSRLDSAKLLTTSLIPEIPLRPQNHQHLGFTKARFTLVISGVSYPDTVQVRLTHSWYQTSLRSDHVSLESVLVLWRHVDPVWVPSARQHQLTSLQHKNESNLWTTSKIKV